MERKVDGILYDDNVLVFCDRSVKNAVIEYGTTIIKEEAFYDCSELEAVVIPDTVETIEALAFGNCTSLKEITIPSNVTKIDDYAFFGLDNLATIAVDWRNRRYEIVDGMLYEGDVLKFCPINKCGPVIVRDGTKRISGAAFCYCGIDSIVLPESLEEIGSEAFVGCCLESINLPSALNIIGFIAFGSCYIKRVSLYTPYIEYHSEVCTEAQVEELFVGKDVESIEWFLNDLDGCIPEIVIENENPYYECIDDAVYYNKDTLIKCSKGHKGTFIIPNGVNRLDYGAFYGCKKITEIVIPNTVFDITELGFEEMVSLCEINVDPNNPDYLSKDGVLYKEDQLLVCPRKIRGCITIPKEVTKIPEGVFDQCNQLSCILVGAGNVCFEGKGGSLYDKAGKCYFNAKTDVIGEKLSNTEELIIIQAYLDGSISRVLKKHKIKKKYKGLFDGQNPFWCLAQISDEYVKEHFKKIFTLTDFFK